MLSKICAGVNPQLSRRYRSIHQGCQRSVLVSIHSRTRRQAHGRRLSKICAGVNPQQRLDLLVGHCRCQRSVLVSIHSGNLAADHRREAVKDLCWCQSTARNAGAGDHRTLSKICAGVNPQPLRRSLIRASGCQRSVLVSIHSEVGTWFEVISAVKDLCWCQSTATRTT